MEFAQFKQLRERNEFIQSDANNNRDSHSINQTTLTQNADDDHFRTLFAELPIAILVLNSSGIVTRANERAVSLLDLQPVGISWREIIAQCFLLNLDMREMAQLKDGRYIDIKTQPIGDNSGQVILLSDITKQQYYQREKERQGRLSLLGEMVASLAHQLRTPLSTSLLYLSQIENKTDSIPDIAEKVAKTKSSLHHLNRIIKDMLLFAGGSQTNFNKILMVELIENILADVSEVNGKSCFKITVANDNNVEFIYGNQDAIRMMLVNFLVNSIQACKEKEYNKQIPQIDIVIRPGIEKEYLKTVEFIIQDNGIGINQENLVQVEEPFFTTKQYGTGLGLPVAKSIIENHHGRLSIKSLDNIGTEIKIIIPLLSNEEI